VKKTQDNWADGKHRANSISDDLGLCLEDLEDCVFLGFEVFDVHQKMRFEGGDVGVSSQASY